MRPALLQRGYRLAAHDGHTIVAYGSHERAEGGRKVPLACAQ